MTRAGAWVLGAVLVVAGCGEGDGAPVRLDGAAGAGGSTGTDAATPDTGAGGAMGDASIDAGASADAWAADVTPADASGSDVATADGAQAPDAAPADSAPADDAAPDLATAAPDAAAPPDLGPAPDAAPAPDTAPAPDAAPAMDAGMAVDTAVVPPPAPLPPLPPQAMAHPKMSFFVTSRPAGKGGNLGGLAGADRTCAELAASVGAVKKSWAAYLSADKGADGQPVHARDRIGAGPWFNARGELFAESLDKLHPTPDAEEMRDAYLAAKPADALFLDERGQRIPESQHDILTGSTPSGKVSEGRTCKDWISDWDGGGNVAIVGHTNTPRSSSPSWNSAHHSQGCSDDPKNGVVSRGGNGRIYCFAKD